MMKFVLLILLANSWLPSKSTFSETHYACCCGLKPLKFNAAKLDGRNSGISDELGTVVDSLPETITVIFQDRHDRMWFAGGGNGVYCFAHNQLRRITTDDGLPSNAVIGIQEDLEGRVYFDTPAGVSRLDGAEMNALAFRENDATTIFPWALEPDDLWFRIDWNRDGPIRCDGEILYQMKFPHLERADVFATEFPSANWSPYGIYSIYRDASGSIWFGTAALGVCRYDGTSFQWLYEQHLTQTPTGGDFGIRSIVEDQDGFFWFSNSRYRYELLADPDQGENIPYQRVSGFGYRDDRGELTYPYFLSMDADQQGTLWLATYDEGFGRMTALSWHNVRSTVKIGSRCLRLSIATAMVKYGWGATMRVYSNTTDKRLHRCSPPPLARLSSFRRVLPTHPLEIRYFDRKNRSPPAKRWVISPTPNLLEFSAHLSTRQLRR